MNKKVPLFLLASALAFPQPVALANGGNENNSSEAETVENNSSSSEQEEKSVSNEGETEDNASNEEEAEEPGNENANDSDAESGDSGDDASNEDAETSGDTGNATSKEEVVYGTLHGDGSLNEIYVVNMFEVNEPGVIIDYGNYTTVTNLTNLTDLEILDGAVQFEGSEGLFYYQGNMEEAELPWDIDISYELDGETLPAEELAGESGHLELTINTTANGNGNELFYENYTLQISLSLDSELVSNLEAEDATIANSGKQRQISYTVMHDTDGEFVLSADVTDFEMDGIDINAIPLSMAMEDPDMDEMKDEMRTLSDAIEEINDGVAELNDGVIELNDGVASLRDGSGDYNSGIRELRDSSSELISASEEIRAALAEMHGGMSGSSGEMDMGELAELPAGLNQMADGLSEAGNGLLTLHENFSAAFWALDGAMDAIPAYGISEEEIQQLYASDANEETVNQLVEVYTAAQTAKGTYNEVREAFIATESVLQETGGSLNEMSGQLSGIASELSASMENMDGMEGLAELEQGLGQLSANYGEFHSGLVEYTNGVGELADAYGEIDSGIGELADGTSELEDGVGELADGTEELAAETSDMPDQIQQEVDQMMANFDRSGFKPVSFVSAHNLNVDKVQFVLTTEAIEIEETEDTAAADEEEESPGFWQRLMNLFS